MARIEKAKGRRANQSPSGYTRIFGVPELGQLMSRVQATVISSGSELERLIWERVRQINDLDAFIDETLHGGEDRVYVAIKKQIKKSQKIRSEKEPDFLAFNPRHRKCYVIEVKDGDTFDTKKSSGERQSLQAFAVDVGRALPFTVTIHVCGFNSRTRDEIFYGMKGEFLRGELMTGPELCALLGVDHAEIVAVRKADEERNLPYFILELLKITKVRDMILHYLKGR